jgi:hypothetical protein
MAKAHSRFVALCAVLGRTRPFARVPQEHKGHGCVPEAGKETLLLFAGHARHRARLARGSLRALYNVRMRARSISRGFTRREWTALVGSVPLLAQVPSSPPQQRVPPEGVPAPAPATVPPEQKLQKALSDIRDVSQRLAQIEVPMNIEPAFVFRP